MSDILYALQDADKYVYHYAASDTLVRFILPTMKFRFSRFECVNDPREAQNWTFDFHNYSTDMDGRVGEISTAFNQHLKRDWWVGCFVSDMPEAVITGPREEAGHDPMRAVFGRGHSRPRMWAQYAERHRGACLVFIKSALDGAVRTAAGSTAKVHCGRVMYSNPSPLWQAPPFSSALSIDCNAIRSLGIDEAAKKHLALHARHLLFMKLLDWKAESEFRWVVSGIVDDQFYIDLRGSLVNILIGEHFPRDLRGGVGEYARENNVSVAYMNWVNGVPQPKPSDPNLISKVPINSEEVSSGAGRGGPQI